MLIMEMDWSITDQLANAVDALPLGDDEKAYIFAEECEVLMEEAEHTLATHTGRSVWAAIDARMDSILRRTLEV